MIACGRTSIMAVVSDELNQWIKRHGNERDALNVALAQLSVAESKLDALQDATLYEDCPDCGGVVMPSCVCLNCGYDSSI